MVNLLHLILIFFSINLKPHIKTCGFLMSKFYPQYLRKEPRHKRICDRSCELERGRVIATSNLLFFKRPIVYPFMSIAKAIEV